MALASLSFLIFSLAPNIWLALPPLVIGGMMLLAHQVAGYSMVQNFTVPHMRGRVISLHLGVSMGAPAIGALLFGWLGDQIGLRVTLAIINASAFLVFLICVIPTYRRRDDMESITGTDS